MNEKSNVKPVTSPVSSSTIAHVLRPEGSPSGSIPKIPESAAVSSVRPDLGSADAAANEAKELAENLNSAGNKALEAVGSLDRARIDKLLSDD